MQRQWGLRSGGGGAAGGYAKHTNLWEFGPEDMEKTNPPPPEIAPEHQQKIDPRLHGPV